MKTILVFLLSLTIALVLPHPTWAHGGGGGGGGGSGAGGSGGSGGGNGGGGGGNGGGGGGSSSSSAGGGGGSGGSGGGGSSSSSAGGGGGSGGGSSSSAGGGGASSSGAGGGANGGGIGHGNANAPGMGHGAGKGPGMAQGAGNAQGMAHGAGKGPARGGGFGFGHASVGNPGHNAFSTLSSHSQNASHKGETHDGRSFSSHSHSTQSLVQDHTDHSNKADQVVQVDDRGPGKEKGFVDSLPPGQEQQADRGMTLNPDTIHSDLDDPVTVGLPPDLELQADRGLTVNLETIHSDLDHVLTRGLQPGQELPADPGGAVNPSMNRLELDGIVSQGLQPGQELQADPGGVVNPSTIRAALDNIVTLGPSPSQEWQTDRDAAFKADTIHLDLHDVVTRIHGLGLKLSTAVPDMDDTLPTALSRRWAFDDHRAKMSPSSNPELDEEEESTAVWLILLFVAVLFLLSRIAQSPLSVRKRKAASLKFEPNASQSTGSSARPPALHKFTATFLSIRERQLKPVDEKTMESLEQLLGNPDVEKGGDGIRGSSGNRKDLSKDFDGIGLG